jgi:hypothetical protein
MGLCNASAYRPVATERYRKSNVASLSSDNVAGGKVCRFLFKNPCKGAEDTVDYKP